MGQMSNELTLPRLADVVSTTYKFRGYVQLNRAVDPSYLRRCREQFYVTETENKVFRYIARAAQGNLDQGKRSLLLHGPFGSGKSLDLVMVHDIFSSLNNRPALKGFDLSVREELLALTSQGPYLVVPVVGTESPMPLSQAILRVFRDAVINHPFLKRNGGNHRLLSNLEHTQAIRWLSEVVEGKLHHLNSAVRQFLQGHSSGHTLTSLPRGLKDFDPDALAAWRECFEVVTGQPPYDVGMATPREVFEEALPTLQEQGVVGIALLIDELSQYLSLYTEYEGEAIRTLDPLVHWINDTSTSFIVVASQTVPEYLQGQTDAEYQAWDSLIRGRFHFIPMERHSYDVLISKSLSRRQGATEDPDRHPQMNELVQSHLSCFAGRGDDRTTAQQLVSGYYPFHPTVIGAIGAIADRLGQSERSVFTYLDQKTDRGFKALIEKRPVYEGPHQERLSLVTLDEIFSFFSQDWAKVEGVDDSLAQASQRAVTTAARSPLARRTLNLVTLLAFLEGRAPLPAPTIAGIAEMLNVPADDELSAVLRWFTDEGHFVFDDAAGYRLAVGTGPRPAEIRSAIQREQAKAGGERITGSTVRDFVQLYRQFLSELPARSVPAFPIEAAYQVEVRKLRKDFKVHFSTSRELVSLATNIQGNSTLAGDVFVGIVTEHDNAGGSQLQEARRAAERLSGAGAVVALPDQAVSSLNGPITDYKATKNVADQERFRNSEVAKAELLNAKRAVLTELSEQFQSTRMRWYAPASAQAVRFNDVQEAVEAAASKLTERFPDVVTHPDLLGRQSNTQVISALLNGGGPIELRGKPRDIFADALQPVGIVTISPMRGDPKRRIHVTAPRGKSPESKKSEEMWSFLPKALPEGLVVQGRKAYDILEGLKRPPYWSPDDLLVYLLAAYLGKTKALVRGVRDSAFHKPSVDDVKKLVKNPSNGLEIHVAPVDVLSDDHAIFAQTLAEAVTETLPEGSSAYGDARLDRSNPEPVLARIQEDLGRWYRDFGAYVSQMASEFDFPQEPELRFLNIIRQAQEDTPDDLGTVRLFRSELPASLSVPSSEAPLRSERTIQTLTALAKARDRIRDAVELWGTSEEAKAAWEEFAAQPFTLPLLEELLKSVEEHQRSRPQPHGGERPQKDGQSQEDGNKGKDRGSTSEISDRSLSVEDLQAFAEFVLRIAGEVESGTMAITNFETLIDTYQVERDEAQR